MCESARGGGLYYKGHLAGVLSRGFQCEFGAQQRVVAVFPNVRSYHDWIIAQFTNQTIPQPGPIPIPQPGKEDEDVDEE